jgi:putative hydrolase of the HAD superfamily
VIGSDVIRKERFKQILEHFQIFDEKLCQDMSEDYMESCPKKANLLPHAMETLHYLSAKYPMSVVTNGFEEIQDMKLTAGNLHQFFQHIVTSQKAGYKKPSREIFDYAMKAHGVVSDEVIMIGDNLLTDIGGANNASIDTVFFNPEQIEHTVSVKHEIRSLAELQNIL